VQEISILKGLNYDCNITQFYGACIQPGGRPMLISEFMDGACHAHHQCSMAPGVRSDRDGSAALARC
jgi:hypothetical protein